MAEANKQNHSHVASILVENYTLKESVSEANGEKSYKLEGLALPFNEFSRNGVLYRTESIKKQYKSMIGNPFLFNHNMEDYPKGKVIGCDLADEGMTYSVDIDPAEEVLIRKLARKEIKNVSIQCMVENPKFYEDGRVEVDVKEFLELSAVTVAGFKTTTAQMIAESFGKTKMKPEKKEKINKEAEGDGEELTELTLEDLKAMIEAQATIIQELTDRVGVLESRLDAEEESKEADGEGEDDTEKPADDGEKPVDDSEEEMDGEDEEDPNKPKEKLKRKAVPSGNKESAGNKTVDFREMRLKRLGY